MIAARGSTRRSLLAWLRLVFAGLMLGALAACANTFDANVTRFQAQMPPPQGQSFAIVADDPGLSGGIEFGQYARLLAGHLVRLGYSEAPSADTANLVVRFGYHVDNGRSYLAPDPFWGPWRGGYYGGFRGRGAWGYGWYDPWFDGVSDSVIYTSEITLKIDDRASGRRLFEGKAQAASISNHLPYLVPNLIDALFTGFPGNSGETVRITVAPEKAAAH